MKLNQLLKIHAIWNPRVYHGWGRSKKFFEGWYYKIVDNSQTNAFAIIPGERKVLGQGNKFLKLRFPLRPGRFIDKVVLVKWFSPM